MSSTCLNVARLAQNTPKLTVNRLKNSQTLEKQQKLVQQKKSAKTLTTFYDPSLLQLLCFAAGRFLAIDKKRLLLSFFEKSPRCPFELVSARKNLPEPLDSTADHCPRCNRPEICVCLFFYEGATETNKRIRKDVSHLLWITLKRSIHDVWDLNHTTRIILNSSNFLFSKFLLFFHIWKILKISWQWRQDCLDNTKFIILYGILNSVPLILIGVYFQTQYLNDNFK